MPKIFSWGPLRGHARAPAIGEIVNYADKHREEQVWRFWGYDDITTLVFAATHGEAVSTLRKGAGVRENFTVGEVTDFTRVWEDRP